MYFPLLKKQTSRRNENKQTNKQTYQKKRQTKSKQNKNNLKQNKQTSLYISGNFSLT